MTGVFGHAVGVDLEPGQNETRGGGGVNGEGEGTKDGRWRMEDSEIEKESDWKAIYRRGLKIEFN
jgi:hypothetical protein